LLSSKFSETALPIRLFEFYHKAGAWSARALGGVSDGLRELKALVADPGEIRERL